MKAIELKTQTGQSMYIELAEEPQTSAGFKAGSVAGVDERVARTIKQLKDVGDAIADVCNTLHDQIQIAIQKSKPSELTLEFSITLAGEAGIPFVTKGTAQGTFQVTSKWNFNKEVAHV
jgi:NTP-dependent ternary system trypsin peptidase co-occuring protein